MVLVGGQGTRLRPLTVDTPKPLLPVAGVPFLAHLLARLREGGVQRVVLSTSFRAEVFASTFGDGSSLGIELVCVVEPSPLGTGGGIRNAVPALRSGPSEPVLALNGDVLSGLDVAGVVAAHGRAGADVTLHLVRVEDPRPFGLVPTDDDGRVREFREKPRTAAEVVTDQVNAGCYVFRRDLLDAIPAGRPVSVERETFPGLLADGHHLHGHVESSYWLDLGTPAAYVRGSADVVLGRAPSPARLGTPGEAVVLDGASVDGSAVLSGGTSVGAGAVVAAGCRLDACVVLDGAQVGPGTTATRSVVGRAARTGEDVVLVDAVVGDRAVVGARVELRDGARVWPDVVLPDGSVRFSPDM